MIAAALFLLFLGEGWGAVLPILVKRFSARALAWYAGAAMVLIACSALQWAAWPLPVWGAVLLTGLALKPLLAWRMLRDEVQAVDAALAVSLDAGRSPLGRLVSGDVSQLSAEEVRESAIDSLAENRNDSVVAPVFWFVLFGLPGAALYRRLGKPVLALAGVALGAMVVLMLVLG